MAWSSHPTPILGTGQHLSPPQRMAREPVLPPLPLTFSAAHGKFTRLGARAWREVARECPLLPLAKSDVPCVLGSGFSQDPLSAGHMGNSFFFFFLNFIYLFIFNCVGSSFLCEGFL